MQNKLSIKTLAATILVKGIVKCTVPLMLVTACGSTPKGVHTTDTLTGTHQTEAGSPGVLEAAGQGGQPDTTPEGGAAGDLTTEGGASGAPDLTIAQGGAPPTMSDAGVAGQASQWPECPGGSYTFCENTGYGYACTIPQPFGQHYQEACQYYCDDDQGVIVPERQVRCQAAGGTCHCLIGVNTLADGGACPTRYECDPSPDTTYPDDAGQ